MAIHGHTIGHMYLRESKQRRSDGSIVTYLQLAENVWDPEKRRSQASIVWNCGRADDPTIVERLRRLAKSILRRASPEEIVADSGDWQLVCAWPHGDVHVLESVWQRLGIGDTEGLELQHLYRAMDFLEAHKEDIEKAIFYRVADLLNLDVEVIFYDTTSLHFEIDEEDRGAPPSGIVQGSRAAGRKAYKAPRQRGHSKNGRSDAPQIVIGLAVTREGFPVRHWVFPGNTVDVTTVAKVKEDLRGLQLTRCLFVGDAGMVSQANFQSLAKGGGKYLMAMPMRRGDEVTEAVLGRPGRYRQVAQNLEVKEVVIGAGERRRRYAVCFNPQEAQRQKAHREELLQELEAELASLSDQGDGHSKRVCALRSSSRYGRFLKETKKGLAIDTVAIRELERFDGKFVVHSNDDTLSAEDMALGYKQLQRVEESWRTMKSGLRMRPVFHWAPHRIHAHIAISVLALLLERTIEHACVDTWRNIRDDLKHIQLAQLLSPNGTVWQVTEPSRAATKRLKLLNIKPPAPILGLA